ncbi:DUF4832 domain-containing protein [Streptomyces sp. H39-S7]|uniref:DUF4832 domain-containing protein n=1 Tax=Streptomyces sp. H39-S7 TaxID=3004357 RepID=UPI0022AF9B0E|nr:DUF4832 domain-containing protein [Streptomyces sp. H39-S7]MCZ4126136.1 DUF4832 domain-containing protein [Streptomyces sp. H39-S7]
MIKPLLTFLLTLPLLAAPHLTATPAQAATTAPSAARVATITAPSATNDATTLTYQFTYTGSPAFARVYLDSDRNAATGFVQGGAGADYLLENGTLYQHTGTGWNWTPLTSVPYSSAGGTARWTIQRADVGESATPGDADLVFQVESPLETSTKLTQTYSGGTTGATVTYATTNDTFANPERGFYHHTGDCDKNPYSLATLQDYRANQGISVVMCVFYLAEFKNSSIDQATLTKLQNQFATARAAGVKMILRFAYTTSTDGADAPKSRVLSHLDQLAPYLSANADVIYLMQAGFIGAWGEGYYTQNFGNAGVITVANWADRKEVTDKILSVLPTTRMVQLRTPKYKRTMYSTNPLPPAQAYNGSTLARLGHHNDCFLASADDYGTYTDPAVEYPYLQAETASVVMGGETCGTNPPRTSCPTALSELRGFHWSYLNTDYHPNVIAGWNSEGCLPEITRRLGYRFALKTGTYPATASRGTAFPVTFTVANDGFAAPVNPRGLQLVLRNTATGALYRTTLTADPRRWAAGTTSTVTQNVTLPAGAPAGSYALLLNLPDPLLSTRPEYSIRLANSATWEAATGFNSLLHTISIN